MSLVSNLRKLREFFTDPEKWTQRAEARDFLGDAVDPENETAVCFCPRGGAAHIFGWSTTAFEIRTSLTDTLRARGQHPDLPVWNDMKETTHAKVLDLIDSTIDRLTAADEELEKALLS
jgi:hypothetical protein